MYDINFGPLDIIEIRAARGTLGLSSGANAKQLYAETGSWTRDLSLELDVIAAWNAAVVVTLTSARDTLDLAVFGHGVAERHMHWVDLPLDEDGAWSVAFEAAWERHSADLRARLCRGTRVFVRCESGLQAACPMMARLLAELGGQGKDAVARLRSVLPFALEDDNVVSRLCAIEWQVEDYPDYRQEAKRDRAAGALLGLAVGNALGVTLQARTRDSEPRLTDMVGGGPFQLKSGQWTSDTAMALALATSLAERKGLDEADLMARFADWADNGAYSCTGACVDIGLTVRRALDLYKETGKPIAGSRDPIAAGNGSLMRVAPVAVRYWDEWETLREVAARQSRTTHGAAEAVEACVAFAEMLAEVITGVPQDIVFEGAGRSAQSRIGGVLAGSWRYRHREELRSTGYVADTLEAALWCVARSGSFAEAVLLAANLAGDSDTVAAVTGQLAGALYGAKSIPPEWLDRLAWRDRIESAALSLASASGL